MVVPGDGAGSGVHPGADHYLTYKGVDTRLSACLYYRALGAVEDCDAQGNPSGSISFADWKTKNGFGLGADVAANFINQSDLNLVRRMVATRSASGNIAFFVCNTPGPDGKSQTEIDRVIEKGMDDKNKVACVAMEYTPVTGANGGQPFTKFFTFGPDGTLLLSINLDGRGEKYMPGACVACHGGSSTTGASHERQTVALPGRRVPAVRHRQLLLRLACRGCRKQRRARLSSTSTCSRRRPTSTAPPPG